MGRAVLGLAFALALASARAPGSSAWCGDEKTSAKVWVGREAEIEELLRTAEVVATEEIPEGVTAPRKLTLRAGERLFAGIFKPIRRGRHHGFWESYEAEIAAYEMDKLLGLAMVPPTVERRVGPNRGSLQWWVEPARLWREIAEQAPRTAEWSHQLSRMEMFDVLIANPDRNAGNILIDCAWNVILIDHSRAFLSQKKLPKDPSRLPIQFDRKIVERLRALDRPRLEEKLGGLLFRSQIDALLVRKERLLEYLDRLVAERGEALVYF